MTWKPRALIRYGPAPSGIAVINVERTISLVCRAITVRFRRKRALVSHDRCWPPPATNWPMTGASVPAVVRELLVEGRLDIRPVHTCRPVVVTSGRASSKLWAGRRTASSVGAHCHADDSALRGCHKSRGTRYSERHSGPLRRRWPTVTKRSLEGASTDCIESRECEWSTVLASARDAVHLPG